MAYSKGVILPNDECGLFVELRSLVQFHSRCDPADGHIGTVVVVGNAYRLIKGLGNSAVVRAL